MPSPKTKTEIDSGHIHRWVPRQEVGFKCITSFNGRMCIKIKVTEQELKRIEEEWANYYQLCQQSEAKKDYDEMVIAHKFGDKEQMKKILERVKKRCRVRENYEGRVNEPKYEYTEQEYMETPDSPEPAHPKGYYYQI